MRTTIKAVVAAVACTAALAGCVADGRGGLAFDPNRINATVAVGAQPAYEEVYQPMPTDVYVSTIVDRDVVVVGGNTYLWVTGPDGVRRREFYAHGDHRAEVFHRREELHSVMAHHGGRLPDRPIGRPGGPEHPFAGGPGHPGGPEHPFGAPGHPGAGGPEHGERNDHAFAGAPNRPMPGGPGPGHAPAPNRPEHASKPEHKDKKS